jgi:hypothetical protein
VETVKQQAQVSKTKVPELIFQDPAFVAADHRLLSGLGGIIVEDPMAFMLIDEYTLVFAKHIPVVLQFTGLLQTCPAVCVSTVSISFLLYNESSKRLTAALFDRISSNLQSVL